MITDKGRNSTVEVSECFFPSLSFRNRRISTWFWEVHTPAAFGGFQVREPKLMSSSTSLLSPSSWSEAVVAVWRSSKARSVWPALKNFSFEQINCKTSVTSHLYVLKITILLQLIYMLAFVYETSTCLQDMFIHQVFHIFVRLNVLGNVNIASWNFRLSKREIPWWFYKWKGNHQRHNW